MNLTSSIFVSVQRPSSILPFDLFRTQPRSSFPPFIVNRTFRRPGGRELLKGVTGSEDTGVRNGGGLSGPTASNVPAVICQAETGGMCVTFLTAAIPVSSGSVQGYPHIFPDRTCFQSQNRHICGTAGFLTHKERGSRPFFSA